MEELLDREERLATRGITQRAECLGNEVLGVANLPDFLRRHPLATSAALGLAAAMVAQVRRRVTRRRGRRRSSLLGGAFRFVRASLMGAVLGQLVKIAKPGSGSRDVVFRRSRSPNFWM